MALAVMPTPKQMKHALDLRMQRRREVGEELHVALPADRGGGME